MLNKHVFYFESAQHSQHSNTSFKLVSFLNFTNNTRVVLLYNQQEVLLKSVLLH